MLLYISIFCRNKAARRAATTDQIAGTSSTCASLLLKQQNDFFDQSLEVDIKGLQTVFTIKEPIEEKNYYVWNNITDVNIPKKESITDLVYVKEEPAEFIVTTDNVIDPLEQVSVGSTSSLATEANRVKEATDITPKVLMIDSEDRILQFFLNIAETVKYFPVNEQNDFKSQVLQIVAVKTKKLSIINGNSTI